MLLTVLVVKAVIAYFGVLSATFRNFERCIRFESLQCSCAYCHFVHIQEVLKKCSYFLSYLYNCGRVQSMIGKKWNWVVNLSCNVRMSIQVRKNLFSIYDCPVDDVPTRRCVWMSWITTINHIGMERRKKRSFKYSYKRQITEISGCSIIVVIKLYRKFLCPHSFQYSPHEIPRFEQVVILNTVRKCKKICSLKHNAPAYNCSSSARNYACSRK